MALPCGQRSRLVHPFCVHIDRLKPYVAELLTKSWLSEADALTPGAPERTDTVADDEDAQQPAESNSETLPIIVEQQMTEQLPDDGGAIAGAPSARSRSPGPKRNIIRPKRFLD